MVSERRRQVRLEQRLGLGAIGSRGLVSHHHRHRTAERCVTDELGGVDARDLRCRLDHRPLVRSETDTLDVHAGHPGGQRTPFPLGRGDCDLVGFRTSRFWYIASSIRQASGRMRKNPLFAAGLRRKSAKYPAAPCITHGARESR